MATTTIRTLHEITSQVARNFAVGEIFRVQGAGVLSGNTVSNGKSALQPHVLRIQSAADYISVSRAYLYLLIERRELVKIKLGARAAGIRRSDLDAWVEAQASR